MIAKYLQKRGGTRPIEWLSLCTDPIKNLVIIPVYDELTDLPLTLDALSRIELSALPSLAVVCIVNNREAGRLLGPARGENERVVEANQETIRLLRSRQGQSRHALGLIDASSPGKELPGKGGVGMARKIACDSAIEYLSLPRRCSGFPVGEVMLFHLDADAQVESTYLTAGDELRTSKCAGGSIRFEHLPAADSRQQRAIDQYELYMHHHVGLLHWAASPYAYHSIGSAMVSTVASYVRAGGMSSKRQAGEDFYFLQQLAKCGGVACLGSTTVHPSSRTSSRVPFGTGPKIIQACETPDEGALFRVPDAKSFAVIKQVMVAFSNPHGFSAALADLPAAARDFLEERGVHEVMARFRAQFSTAEQIRDACHAWFDGLATIRLIHLLSDSLWPSVPLMEGWMQMIREVGVCPDEDIGTETAMLRWWLNTYAFPTHHQ